MKKELYQKLRDKIIESNPSILDLKVGCKIIVDRVNSDKKWNIKTYVSGHTEIPERIGRKLNKNKTKFILVLQEYRTDKNELNLNKEIEVDKIIKIIGRDIRLDDVFVAIKKTGKMLSVEDTGNFRTYPDGCRIMDGEYMSKWKFNKKLEEQSSETINFLYNLICGKTT